MKRSQRIAVSGMLTAFAAVAVILSNLVPTGMYTFPAAAGIVIWVLSFFAGNSYAVYSYIAVSLLSFILCTNKEAAFCFILFLGYYPLIRKALEKIRLKVLAYLIKLLVFNAAAVSVYILLVFVFSVPADEFELFGIKLPFLFLGLMNIVFIVYDTALRLFERRYREIINKTVTNFFRRF